MLYYKQNLINRFSKLYLASKSRSQSFFKDFLIKDFRLEFRADDKYDHTVVHPVRNKRTQLGLKWDDVVVYLTKNNLIFSTIRCQTLTWNAMRRVSWRGGIRKKMAHELGLIIRKVLHPAICNTIHQKSSFTLLWNLSYTG